MASRCAGGSLRGFRANTFRPHGHIVNGWSGLARTSIEAQYRPPYPAMCAPIVPTPMWIRFPRITRRLVGSPKGSEEHACNGQSAPSTTSARARGMAVVAERHRRRQDLHPHEYLGRLPGGPLWGGLAHTACMHRLRTSSLCLSGVRQPSKMRRGAAQADTLLGDNLDSWRGRHSAIARVRESIWAG
jgi:hypothetical protein